MHRARRVSARRAVLGRHRAARPRGGGALLRGRVRLGVRRPDAARTRPGATTSPSCAGATSPPSGRCPEGMPPAPGVDHLRVRGQRRRRRRAGPRRPAGKVLMGPFDVFDAGRMALLADTGGRRVRASGSPGATKRRPARQRARDVELQRAQHARPGGARGLLRRGVRVGGEPSTWARAASRCGGAPATATTWRSATPARASACGGVGAPEGFEDAVAWLVPMGAGRGRAAALGHHLRASTTPTPPRREGRRARRRGARAAARRAVGAA